MSPAEALRVYWAATYVLLAHEWNVYDPNRETRELSLIRASLARRYQTRALNAWCHSEEAYR